MIEKVVAAVQMGVMWPSDTAHMVNGYRTAFLRPILKYYSGSNINSTILGISRRNALVTRSFGPRLSTCQCHPHHSLLLFFWT